MRTIAKIQCYGFALAKTSKNVLGVRRSWRAGADCKSVVLRLRWFESTHSHQNKKCTQRVLFYFDWSWFMVLDHTNEVCLVRQAVDFTSDNAVKSSRLTHSRHMQYVERGNPPLGGCARISTAQQVPFENDSFRWRQPTRYAWRIRKRTIRKIIKTELLNTSFYRFLLLCIEARRDKKRTRSNVVAGFDKQ